MSVHLCCMWFECGVGVLCMCWVSIIFGVSACCLFCTCHVMCHVLVCCIMLCSMMCVFVSLCFVYVVCPSAHCVL